MKTAMILDAPFPPDPRVENEARSLIEHGIKVDLYCLSFREDQPVENINDLNVIRIRVPKIMRSLSALAYSLPLYHWILFFKLTKVLKPEVYDAIHIHDMQSARSIFWLLKNFRGKVILDLHENRPEIMKYYDHVKTTSGKILIKPAKWKFFEEYYINKADKVVVVTQSARDYYVDNYGVEKSKFIVVPNTVSKSFYQKPLIDQKIAERYQDKFVLLYVGDTGERRGIGEVLEAVHLLRKEIPELIFVCVGNSKKSDPKWAKYIKAKDLHAHVDLTGWKDFNLFPSYIAASDICLSPLQKNIHHDTTYANKLFQYMAFDKPLIVSSCKAQAELVEENKCGLVFKAGSTEDLAHSIQALYMDTTCRKKMGKNGKSAVEKTFNWKSSSEHLIKYYKND